MPSQPEEATPPTAPRDDAPPQPQQEAPSASPFPPPPILTLTKSILRTIHAADAPAIQRAANSPGVAKYMSLRFPSPYTLDDAKFWVGYASAFTAPGRPDVLPSLAICDRATGTLLGGIGIKTREDIEAHSFEVGYWLGEDGWGKGVMSEACRAYVKWVFETYPAIIRLEAGVFEGNDASVKVLERSGFVYEGTRRKAGMKHGVVFDILVFGLLREECTW
ncbi:acyl-CoA N-acyltransferase [Parachaetomium inaequale]|uniref:Acyl-CoA N-acyltransferase n=1 Tax=Parachaetomium inaequale TaxID=2588326 RepID=A0AAN6P9B9_9PEZI|nr:acyl-CoA N-acyltransferase [Parachaetomium inaequale]